MDFGQAHERHLAAHRVWDTEVWCSNRECENHFTAQTVRVESEYGQAWYMPEECPKCFAGWLDEEPKEDE